MIKAVFFDFDGVLTKNKSGFENTCKNLSRATSVPLERISSAYNVYRKDFNKGIISVEEFWRNFCEGVGRKLDINILYRAFSETEINKPVFELAKNLKRRYKVGIISNNPKGRVELILKEKGIDDIFDGVFLSWMTKSLKPEKQIFHLALKSLNLKPEEAVFIDNKDKYAEAARGYGMEGIHFDDEKNDVDKLKEDLVASGVELV